MRTRFLALTRDTRGVAAVEFALLLPLLVVTAFGSFEICRLAQASLRVRATAQAIADLVAQQDTVTTTIMSDICTGASLMMTPFAKTGLTAAVASVTYASAGRAQDWQDDSCGSATKITNAVALAITDTASAGSSAIVVTVSYAYTSPTSVLLSSAAMLSATAIAKPRNGTSIGHS